MHFRFYFINIYMLVLFSWDLPVVTKILDLDQETQNRVTLHCWAILLLLLLIIIIVNILQSFEVFCAIIHFVMSIYANTFCSNDSCFPYMVLTGAQS